MHLDLLLQEMEVFKQAIACVIHFIKWIFFTLKFVIFITCLSEVFKKPTACIVCFLKWIFFHLSSLSIASVLSALGIT